MSAITDIGQEIAITNAMEQAEIRKVIVEHLDGRTMENLKHEMSLLHIRNVNDIVTSENYQDDYQKLDHVIEALDAMLEIAFLMREIKWYELAYREKL